MNPLFEKFFHGELTDREDSELDALLRSSEDAAWDFGRMAERIYKRYGLPESRLPGTIKWTAFLGDARIWIVLLLLLALFLAWKVKGCGHRPPPSAPPPAAVPAKKAPVKKAVRRPVATPTATAVPVKKAPVEAMTEEARIKAIGTNLRVVVNRATAGPVAVNVYDAKGVAVRLLYDGTLQPGRWAFQWDGRDAAGRLVDPGKYRIEVKSEGLVQNKEVDIR